MVSVLSFLMIESNAQVFVGESFTLKPPVKSCLDYSWDFGDGTSVSTEDTVVSHTYETSGEFIVTLLSEYFCVEEQINKTDTVINTIKAELNFNNYVNYGPNPYSTVCNISYTLPCDAQVHIYVTDQNGALIADIANETQSPGSYNYGFSAKNLGYPAGSYNLQCEIDGQLYFYHLQELP